MQDRSVVLLQVHREKVPTIILYRIHVEIPWMGATSMVTDGVFEPHEYHEVKAEKACI